MTDKEKACKTICGNIPCKTLCTMCKCYLAGLKAGRVQWHDLQKNPNDYPKDDDEKLCLYKKGKVIARYNGEYNCWGICFNNLGAIVPLSAIIAWCELPKFEVEE